MPCNYMYATGNKVAISANARSFFHHGSSHVHICPSTQTVTSAISMAGFTRLPNEIQRDIFLLACKIDRRSIPQLILVAHRFSSW